MENTETINLILIGMFIAMAISSLFISYFFWAGENGQLRKIMIVNKICMAVMFLVFGGVVYLGHPSRIVAILGGTPYLISNIRFILYLFKNVKEIKR